MCAFNDAYDNCLSNFGPDRAVAAHQGDPGHPAWRGRWSHRRSLANLWPADAPLGCETRAQPWKGRMQTPGGCQGAPSGARKESWKAERNLGSLLRRLL